MRLEQPCGRAGPDHAHVPTPTRDPGQVVDRRRAQPDEAQAYAALLRQAPPAVLEVQDRLRSTLGGQVVAPQEELAAPQRAGDVTALAPLVVEALRARSGREPR